MLQEDKDNQLAHLRLYTIYKKKKDFDNARQHLMKILAYDPNYKTDAILFFIADSYHRQKDYEQALKYYQKSHQQTQEKFLVLLQIGECHILLRQFDQAKTAFEQAIFLNNKAYEPFYKLGLIQLELNQNRPAVENLFKAHSL